MSKSGITIGILAEDSTDVEVMKSIFSKYAPENSFSVKKFVGNGCGKLRNKCEAWAQNLVKSGCQHIIMLHDLDQNIEQKLRADLAQKIGFVAQIKFELGFSLMPYLSKNTLCRWRTQMRETV